MGKNKKNEEEIGFVFLSSNSFLDLPNFYLFLFINIVLAVKCNTDHEVLRLLAKLGANFDCASKSELKSILDLGVSPDRIIYANPCKQPSFIR